MKKIFITLLAALILVGCSDEKLNDRSVVDEGRKQIESTELDKWILDNITKPYGIEVVYRWEKNAGATGSTGQNAFEQAKQFIKATDVTSLAITKLDGTAKGGVVLGISHQLKVPVRYIGLGERMQDLQPFNKTDFVESLFDTGEK